MTRYQQWLDEGADYWVGIALLNQVRGYATLKRTLSHGPSTYNTAKLRGLLQVHLKGLPATTTGPRTPKGHTLAAPGTTPPPAEAITPTPIGKSSLKAQPFGQLPTSLQQYRLETIERTRKRSALHTSLVHGIEEAAERLAVVRDIVELSDAIDAYWTAERQYVKTGAVPTVEPSDAEKVAAMDPFACHRTLTNQVRPRVHRLKQAIKRAAGDKEKLLRLNMELATAEQLKQLLMDRIRQYDQKRKA